MTITTFRTSSPEDRVGKSTHVADCTLGPETLTLGLSADQPLGTSFTAIKTDVSANAFTVQDVDGNPIAILEAQNDAATMVWVGTAYSVESNASSSDVSSHAALSIAHGSEGEVQGATEVDTKVAAGVTSAVSTSAAAEAAVRATGATYNNPIINWIRDPGGAAGQHQKVLQFAAGAATPVNYFGMANSGTGGPAVLSTDGTDTDVGISLEMKGAGNFELSGAGKFVENGANVAINSNSAQADSTAILLATLVNDFNALLDKLRASRILNP